MVAMPDGERLGITSGYELVIVDKQMQQRVWWGDTDWNPELVLEDIKSLIAEQ